MMSRRSLTLLVVALILFSGSAWAGFWAHGVTAAKEQLAQPGWCCMPSKSSCVVSETHDDCRTQGGTVFNWDAAACSAICKPSRAQKAPSSAPLPQ